MFDNLELKSTIEKPNTIKSETISSLTELSSSISNKYWENTNEIADYYSFTQKTKILLSDKVVNEAIYNLFKSHLKT